MQKIAIDENHYEQGNELLASWEKFCLDLEFELPVELEFGKISIDSLLKAAGVSLVEDYDSLAEKLIDYMQLVERFEGKKLFILVNMRSYIEDTEMQKFIETTILRGYYVLLLENHESKTLEGEKRYLIDADLCEICYTE